MALKRVLYQSIKGGANDTAAPNELKDDEARVLENVDIGERGGGNTRPGCAKVNDDSKAQQIVQEFEWITAGRSRKIAVTADKKLWWVGPSWYDNGGSHLPEDPSPGTMWELVTVSNVPVSIVPIQNKLYICDGADIYVWGDYDYEAEGTQTVAIGKIVKNSPASSGGGVANHFYQAVTLRTSINLATENYANTTNWTDVTDIANIISKVIRSVTPKNAAAFEVDQLVINYSSSAAANVTVTLNGVSKTVAVASGDTATAVAGKIRAATFTGWTTGGSGSTVTFTSTTAGERITPEYDPGTTQAYGAMTVKTAGSVDGNGFAEAKKCRVFLQHPLSLRIFAIGHPDYPTAVYYSDLNDITYWPEEAVLFPTGSEGRAIALNTLSDDMLVGYDIDWWHWSGIDPDTDATWKPLPIPYGPLSNESVVLTPFSFTFVSKTGIYTVSASILNQDVVMLQSNRMITPLAEGRAEAAIKSIRIKSSVRATFNDNKIMVAYNDDQMSSYNNKVLVYDMAADGFTTITGWQVNWWNNCADGSLRFASKNYVLLTGQGLHDIDVETGLAKAINFHIETKDFDLGSDLTAKYLVNLYMLFKQFASATGSSVNISVLGDYARDSVDGLSLDYDQAALDESMVWGRTWGKIWGWSDVMELVSQPAVMARTFRLKITNSNIDDPVGFYGVGFEFKEVRPRGRNITDGSELIT